MTATKQTQSREVPLNKKSGPKTEPILLPEQTSSSFGIGELSGDLAGANGNPNSGSQAARLNNPYLQTIQRQIMARQVGQTAGNHYLQRAVTTMAPKGSTVVGINPSVSSLEADVSMAGLQARDAIAGLRWSVQRKPAPAKMKADPTPKIGWKGAPAKTYNAEPSKIGKLWRIPLSNLNVGQKSKYSIDAAYEDANNEAIALVPAAIQDSKEENLNVDVLLHFHGYGIGYRTRKTRLTTTVNDTTPDDPDRTPVPGGGEKTVRDISLDRIAGQIEASGRQVIGILPQGGLKSQFGDFNSDDYIGSVFEALKKLNQLPSGVKPGGVILTGHSGGGDEIARLHRSGREPQKIRLRELVLFDAIHVNKKKGLDEAESTSKWLVQQIENELGEMQKAASTDEEQANWLRANGFRFRAYHSKTGGYPGTYKMLRKKLKAAFQSNKHITTLGSQALGVLRMNYHLHEKWGTGADYHEQLLGQSSGIEKALEGLPGGKASTAIPAPKGTSPAVKAPTAPKGTPPAVKATAAPGAASGSAVTDTKPAPSKSKDSKKKPKTAKDAQAQAALTDDERKLLPKLRKAQQRYRELDAKSKTKGEELSDEEKTEEKELAKELGAGSRIIAKSDIEMDIAVSPAKTVENWFAGIRTDATFMDVPIGPSKGSKVPGVHQELLDHFATAEEYLKRLIDEDYEKRHHKKPGFSKKADYAHYVNLYSISGLRPPQPATGGKKPSLHCYGLAVDINYQGNPYIGFHKKVRKTAQAVIKNATLLVTRTKMDVKESPEKGRTRKSALEMWDRLNTESEALKTYFSLGKDKDKLKEHVEALHNAGNKRENKRSVEDWQKLIEEDYAALYDPTGGKDKKGEGKGDFAGHNDPAQKGFMELDRLLVEALTKSGLTWGGTYGGAKDLMHFDLRGKATVDRKDR
ncbi:MAG TPA: M15 family metallopeptidase [Anaerolineales bacterium]|nr:M15 family metallopeptidase [Anaerolineales bacterium]